MTTRLLSAIAIATVAAVLLYAAPTGDAERTETDETNASNTANTANTANTGADSDTVVTGRVVDDFGNPVAGVVVMPNTDSIVVQPADPTTDGVVTDAEGRFVIHGLAPGSYYFTAIHGHYPPGASRALPVDTDGRTELELVLEPTDYIRA